MIHCGVVEFFLLAVIDEFINLQGVQQKIFSANLFTNLDFKQNFGLNQKGNL